MFSDKFKTRYFEELGLPKDGAEKKAVILASLARADHIREFEIELYWKRTLYMWGVTAAFLAIFVMVISSAPTIYLLTETTLEELPTGPTDTQLIIGFFISLMALTISVLWGKLLEGAKYWQNNWERHVDLLEEAYGANLYKVYPVYNGESEPPFSVTKINGRMVLVIQLFWLLSLTLVLCQLLGIDKILSHCLFFITGPVIIIACLFWVVFLSRGLRMSNYGTVIFPYNEPKGDNSGQKGILISRVISK